MREKLNFDTRRLVGTAIFAAIIIVLQSLGSFIRFGTFSISLVLVPIAVGAAVYGKAAGAIFGGVFGLVVLINCINGTEIGGNMLWAAKPVMTAVLCMGKGILAGFVGGAVYSAISKYPKKEYIGAVCAAFAVPAINTGIFLAGVVLFFKDTLFEWAGDTNIIYYVFIGLAGGNFLIELVVNLVISPAIVRILNAIQKRV